MQFLLPPLTAFEVKEINIKGRALVLDARFNINMTAQTLEQVVAKMQRSHEQLIDLVLEDLQAAEPPPRALLELQGRKSEAHKREPEFFVDAECVHTSEASAPPLK